MAKRNPILRIAFVLPAALWIAFFMVFGAFELMQGPKGDEAAELDHFGIKGGLMFVLLGMCVITFMIAIVAFMIEKDSRRRLTTWTLAMLAVTFVTPGFLHRVARFIFDRPD